MLRKRWRSNFTYHVWHRQGAGPELPAGQTNYRYAPLGCPQAGDYTLGNFIFGCFDDAWFPLIGDHTPADQDGYFMLVNSAYVKGDLFVQKLSGLCANTRYEFSCWVKNPFSKVACKRMGVDPNLLFRVETTAGVVLAEYSTSQILKSDSGPEWRQFGTVFQAPAGVNDVVLRIRNISGDGCGNVLALDDVMVRACGAEVRAVMGTSGLNVANLCEGDNTTYLLKAVYDNSYTNPAFQWQTGNGLTWQNIPGATTATYLRQPTGVGSYLYRVLVAEASVSFSSQCRVGSNEILIGVLSLPFVQATGYIYGCLDGEVSMIASGAASYLWTGPNG